MGIKMALRIALLLLFLSQAAISRAVETIPADTKIVLTRGQCLGPCPVYTLVILADGKVVYNGQEFVNVFGQQEKYIPQDKVKMLLDEFEKIEFPSLEKQISDVNNPDPDSLGDEVTSYTTDVPSTEIAFTINGKTYFAKHDGNNYEHEIFKEVDDLATFIDKTVETINWISPPRFSEDEKLKK